MTSWSDEATRQVSAGRYNSEAEAEMWAELLRRAGVPCVVVPLMPNIRMGSFAYVPHEIRVRDGDADTARGVLGEEPPNDTAT